MGVRHRSLRRALLRVRGSTPHKESDCLRGLTADKRVRQTGRLAVRFQVSDLLPANRLARLPRLCNETEVRRSRRALEKTPLLPETSPGFSAHSLVLSAAKAFPLPRATRADSAG